MSARSFQILLGVLIGCNPSPIAATTVLIPSGADTTLIQTQPTNNLGGATIVNAGTTQNFTRNRGLFRFEVASQIPRGARINSVDFVVEVTGQPRDGFTPSSFGLHRLLKSWGEGNKISADATHPGFGSLATIGEATWNSRFALTTNVWSLPGGAATNDYAADFSAQAGIYGVGDSPYTFVSTAALVADVQSWVDDPAANYGWILISRAEEVNFTARRFASREDPGREPYLVVDFTPPLIVERAVVIGSSFQFQFTAAAGKTYSVEFRDSFTSPVTWQTATNIPAQASDTTITFAEPSSRMQRFYRVRSP